MNIVQLTPGAGGMYCGNCLHDNALVRAWRNLGHQVLMVPLYLPLTLDEPDESAGTRIFFGGISVYLEQKSALFRRAPRWLHGLLASRPLLRWAAGRAAKTRPADTGDLTLSMLRGEAGHQVRELGELVAWLKTQPVPDAICLSNAMLLGMARRLRKELAAPVICLLQGEDAFLDALPEPHRSLCWQTLAERAAEVECLVAPSRYYAERMCGRLALPRDRVQVVFNGVNLDGFPRQPGGPPRTKEPPVLGYFARMCPEKGLETLISAYLILRKRGRSGDLKLRIGGSCGASDQPFVEQQRARLKAAGLLAAAELSPNLSRAEKLEFLRSLTVFSVPAVCGEAFGLYLIEALAAGVPFVQPRSGAFPELSQATRGGLLCEPGDPESLALAIESLILDPDARRELSERGHRAVFEKFSAQSMAQEMIRLIVGTGR